MTFNIPATAPKKKKIIINHGLVPNQLSKINPIIVPTPTAAINSVPGLIHSPKEPLFSLSGFICLFIFDFAIFRRVLKSSGVAFLLCLSY